MCSMKSFIIAEHLTSQKVTCYGRLNRSRGDLLWPTLLYRINLHIVIDVNYDYFDCWVLQIMMAGKVWIRKFTEKVMEVCQCLYEMC